MDAGRLTRLAQRCSLSMFMLLDKSRPTSMGSLATEEWSPTSSQYRASSSSIVGNSIPAARTSDHLCMVH